MEILNSSTNLAAFFASLEEASSRVLFLDYDGTLAPFREDPAQAHPYPGVPPLLEQIRDETDTQLVVVTGRSIDSLRPLLQLDSVEIWGSHGWERLCADGTRALLPIPEGTLMAFERMVDSLQQLGLERFWELKPACVAIHWRGLEGSSSDRLEHLVRAAWKEEDERRLLNLRPFDGGIEVRIAGQGKGNAVTAVLSKHTSALAAYLGDDLTDEDAFAALEGRGLRVLVRPELRESAADLWLKPPGELLDFLRAWLAAAKGS